MRILSCSTESINEDTEIIFKKNQIESLQLEKKKKECS